MKYYATEMYYFYLTVGIFVGSTCTYGSKPNKSGWNQDKNDLTSVIYNIGY